MHWLDVLIGSAGGATGIFAALKGGMAKLIKRVVHDASEEATKEIKTDLAALKLKLAAETGGNSNGLRQKLNEVGEDLAKLTGAFEQHVKDGRP